MLVSFDREAVSKPKRDSIILLVQELVCGWLMMPSLFGLLTASLCSMNFFLRDLLDIH